ncbi:hypothetical protein JIN84_04440 [Luteolibacter yonseiensis]|uniref:Uncharacterized protein n=1 Tax=Luteolibacter yonseiensis TaxID=1144680 RepID=A0A934VA72_9BACT|nr:hypothetical protein [Luteolibacter yonseiensis]MBK1814850.1 hypothetical protein [Luteolibacter yonseiensis]
MRLDVRRIKPLIEALSAILSVVLLYLAVQGHPTLGIPGMLLLLQLVVSRIVSANERKERRKMSAIVSGIFGESSPGRPDFVLSPRFRAPNVELIFKSPEDAREAERNGTLQESVERVRNEYSIPIFLDKEDITGSLVKKTTS